MSAACSYDSDMEGPESQNLPGAPSPPHQSVEAIPSVGLTRRRVAVLVAGIFALWLVGVFARQVGNAAAAGDHAEAMRARNAALEGGVTALRSELELIQRPAFVASTARGYLIGSPGEIPFTIDRKGSALPANAPGSVGIKPEGNAKASSPLESWLSVLFGP